MPGNLVLQRSVGEEIVIQCPDGTVIPIKYVEHKSGGRIRLSVNAPKAYRVDRSEVVERRKAQWDKHFATAIEEQLRR